MNSSTETDAAETLWALILGASRLARTGALATEMASSFALRDGPAPELRPVPAEHQDAAIAWSPRDGWQLRTTPLADPLRALAELYLHCANH